ncbi:MAG: peroxidase family protein, partial [Gemmatimonadaceae bacterium]
NLFDNSGTFEEYVNGRAGMSQSGSTLQSWPSMRLPATNPNFTAVGGTGPQLCQGSLIRGRTLSGICNDIFNPLMGSTGTLFARNVEFESTFPDLSTDSIARNRHGNRLALLTPDPQVVSRRLFTRGAATPADTTGCNNGLGQPGYPATTRCDYAKAPFFNVLAAYWIQFMTHDWFSHLEDGHNDKEYESVGCTSHKVNGVETPLTAAEIQQLGCRPGDKIDKTYVADATQPGTFQTAGGTKLARAPKTYANTNTAWWDASQIYGYDESSQTRVKRDPKDHARLLMISIPGRNDTGDAQGYLPTLAPTDPMNPEWAGQEATGFPDNWTIGISFYHNVFAREHNQFVDAFRARAKVTPNGDSGLRNPSDPKRVIKYSDVSDDELYTAARLVVSAEIAKIHTIEWTPQLLYDEPLYRGMNGNWNGLVGKENGLGRAMAAIEAAIKKNGKSLNSSAAYSVLAAGPGIVGLGNARIDQDGIDRWSLENANDVGGGVNHFGSPFNFPEEFITVYRLHSLMPDLIEYRDQHAANEIRNMIPVVATFQGKATAFMHDRGLSNWALSLGRQRLGLVALNNHPRFLQNLQMGRLESETGTIDVAALDLIRDRERGVPRFNEFRRQYGLRQLTSFDDFIDRRPGADTATQRQQTALAATMRELYGTHVCDASKIITRTQRDEAGNPINDCLGHPNGSTVDNIEDLDTVVGWLAESTRPHGYAISETQFVVFILNASRRLFSDRFFTSSYRPEFYTTMGIDWVNNNGPVPMIEAGDLNGHPGQQVSPLKRVLLRTLPELKPELDHVVNAFDPWARDRGSYYSLDWKPRPDAKSDPAFARP